MATLAAVDLGAQSGRVAVGRFDGERLGVTEVHRFPNVPVRTRETLNWDILRVYRDVLDGLRAAAREAGHVDSVAVDSWGVDFALIDWKGRLVQNPVHYRDARRARAMDRVLARVPARELYERTGIQLMPINTVFELGAMAAEADPALDAAGTMLLIPDLLHYWLCGASTSEFTNATTTQCFDPRTGGWATDLLERLDVPTRLLPEVVQPGTRLAPLGAAVAEETRLGDAEVVAVATHDTGAAVAAVPFRQPGSVFISAGTWSLVGLEVQAPVITDAAVNIAPTLKDKVDIVQNAIDLVHAFGAEARVAILSAMETVNPDVPSTIEAVRSPAQPVKGQSGESDFLVGAARASLVQAADGQVGQNRQGGIGGRSGMEFP